MRWRFEWRWRRQQVGRPLRLAAKGGQRLQDHGPTQAWAHGRGALSARLHHRRVGQEAVQSVSQGVGVLGRDRQAQSLALHQFREPVALRSHDG